MKKETEVSAEREAPLDTWADSVRRYVAEDAAEQRIRVSTQSAVLRFVSLAMDEVEALRSRLPTEDEIVAADHAAEILGDFDNGDDEALVQDRKDAAALRALVSRNHVSTKENING